MIRFILLSVLLTIVYRAAANLWSGIVRGMQSPGQASSRSRTPRANEQGVRMARDPVCGTFVVPDTAVALSSSDGQRHYFCSADCRDKFRAASPAAHGRTA